MAESNAIFRVHCALISALCVVDIVLNSTVEYGNIISHQETSSNTNTIITIVQVLLQIFALINFFALLGATFLFRSGLFSLLYSQFRFIILAHPLYILQTVVLGGVRVKHLSSGVALSEIWDSSFYIFFSFLQKMGAIYAYVCSIHAIEKLRNPKFYDQEYWLRR
ncbi:TPA: hypothetical protein N0F65_012912 [Lagenidium giganteum]|uniref:Transmembrane protein 138 n=1 Tax=Lagenidium giganteum TaxID=4803 RepID=A0AAV2YUR7_9STRA|nr:TPA: hypothetical protein N0F65_012912 [Lagenidium giganteum]